MSLHLSKIVIGGMRFKDRDGAVAVIRNAIDAGFNYIDTAPAYCLQNELENSESWIGEAINHPDYRDRVLVASKCAPGNGGLGLGEFVPEKGFGVRSAQQLGQVFDQSRRRLGVERFDYYHLWTTHTQEQFQEAFKPQGWYAGLLERVDNWDHLGLTTHADSGTIIRFLESGVFDTVTLPLNVINATRMEAVKWCARNGIRVIAMNPLAGGFLAGNDRLKGLALRYLMALENVRILIGLSSVQDVEYAKWIVDTTSGRTETPDEIANEVRAMLGATEPHCTACGYCQPCPEAINIGACLSYYNLYHYLGMAGAKQAFREKQWEDGLRLDKCQSCGICESRCPNTLQVMKIIGEARTALYG